MMVKMHQQHKLYYFVKKLILCLYIHCILYITCQVSGFSHVTWETKSSHGRNECKEKTGHSVYCHVTAALWMYCRYFWLTLVLQSARWMRTHAMLAGEMLSFFWILVDAKEEIWERVTFGTFSLIMKPHQSKQSHSRSDWWLTKTLPSPGSLEEVTSLVGLLKNLSSLVSILCTWFYTVLWLLFQGAFHNICLLLFCASGMTYLHFKGNFPTGKLRMWHTKHHLQEQVI